MISAMRRRVVFFVYPGFELLDLAGPNGVFSAAARREPDSYATVCASLEGGLVEASCGTAVRARRLSAVKPAASDTLLVIGAEAAPLRRALRDERIARALRAAAGAVERIGSVCSGAFLLAAAGLLDGRRAATHWEGCAAFRRAFPRVRLQDDALYAKDGRFWTSAGVTTGIDMALEIVRRDLGPRAMASVARRLVVYTHRPGGQSQFSAALQGQLGAAGEFAPLVDELEARLDRPVKVAELARRAAMSERTFYRRFTQAVGQTPSRFVETLRLERARRLLESGAAVKAVAPAVGFGSPAVLRAAFAARFGISPSTHRLMHAQARARG